MNFKQRKKEIIEEIKDLQFATSPTEEKGLLWRWTKHGLDILSIYIDNKVSQSLSDYKKELVEKFEKIGEETFESNKISCPSCGEPVKDTDILVKDTWIYRDLVSLLQKDKEAEK